CLYDENRQKIVLFLDVDLEKSYINDKISKLVPDYMFPNKVVYMETMPINLNGKIDRVKLKEFL
ncbi:MAG: D-alanine--poly(phosphoribitol) ligase, partial [Lachnospiraceae bacterium]|nr:D-alanine--poly(phosphoribitol) ligase [Lachnospiraceae bacterium]